MMKVVKVELKMEVKILLLLIYNVWFDSSKIIFLDDYAATA